MIKYKRWSPSRRPLPIRERIEAMSIPEPNSGCWLWLASLKNKKGYPGIHFNGAVQAAHRISYEAFVGEIPKGLMVLHRCDVPSCVNPAHLFLGTAKENEKDRAEKGRPKGPRGEKTFGSKLVAAQVIAIRADTRGNPAIAEAYGVDVDTIWRVKARRTWRHVRA